MGLPSPGLLVAHSARSVLPEDVGSLRRSGLSGYALSLPTLCSDPMQTFAIALFRSLDRLGRNVSFCFCAKFSTCACANLISGLAEADRSPTV